MPRQQSIDSNSSNSNNNSNMNVNPHATMNFQGSRGGGGGNNSGGGKQSGPGMSVGDHIRNRYGHHGPGGDPGSGGASGPSGGSGGQAAAAAAAAMGDYSRLPNHQFPLSHSGRTAAGLAPGLGSFNPAIGGMNPAAMMNPSLYMGAGAAALSQHEMAQGASLGEHFGGNSGAPANPTSAQAEREEELLLNLLIARRQRQAMRTTEPHQMAPGEGGGGGGGGGGQSTSWTDDWMRLRQQQEQLGASGGGAAELYDGIPSSGGEGSNRRASANSRMGMSGGGMGQLPNVNVNNMANMSGGTNQHQFLQDSSSRLQQQRGNGMGLMGSPQASWSGGNGNAGGMHSHSATPRNDNVDVYGNQRGGAGMNMMGNTQLKMDVLERVPDFRPNMMFDARMADQGGMGQNPYQFAGMGRQHGQSNLNDRASLGGYKRQLDGQSLKTEKQMNPRHQMQHFFGSPQKANPPEDVQPPKKRRLHKKKPADMPRRPLSAYNLFFSEERERILREIEGKSEVDKKDPDGKDESKPKALLRPLLPSEKKRRPHRKTHGKISFQELATKVGQRWKALPDDRRKYYQDLAQEDMKRQKKAMEEYYQKRSALTANEANTKEA